MGGCKHMSEDDVEKQLDQLQKAVKAGDINLFALMAKLKILLKAQKKTQKGFFKFAHITYSPVRQIFFNGRQNRKGSGKPIKINQMPDIVKKARLYLFS